jgi:hypothetical protein
MGESLLKPLRLHSFLFIAALEKSISPFIGTANIYRLKILI